MTTELLDKRFQVRGLDRDTCVERTLTVMAETEEEAVRKAADLGMVVERVDKMLPPKEEDLPDELLNERTSIRTTRELKLLSPVERVSWIATIAIGVMLQAVGWCALIVNIWAVPENPNPDPMSVAAARLLDLRHGQTTTNALLTIIAGTLSIIAACHLHARGTLRRTHSDMDA